MFELRATGWTYLEDLQLVHADIEVNIEDTIVLDEPFSVQNGVASLLLSAIEDVHPLQFIGQPDWRTEPFFVCGCGDSSCRAALFKVTHLENGSMEWCELMQSETGGERQGDTYMFNWNEYVPALIAYGQAYLAVLRDNQDTLGEELQHSMVQVEQLLERLTSETSID
jgi:hypothetical protein